MAAVLLGGMDRGEVAPCCFFYKTKLPLGPWHPEKYKREITENAVDFARSGSALCLVFDCPGDRIEAVRAFMEEQQARGELQYGMHVSDYAVMTCFVTSPAQNEHVHFIDGGDGGYTTAATQLKAKAGLIAPAA